GDPRSRKPGQLLRPRFDDGAYRIDHVARVAILLHRPVETDLKVQRLRVRDLVARYDPRTGRARSVKALALEVLPAPAALDVPCRHVVQHRVTKDIGPHVSALHVSTAPANRPRQL